MKQILKQFIRDIRDYYRTKTFIIKINLNEIEKTILFYNKEDFYDFYCLNDNEVILNLMSHFNSDYDLMNKNIEIGDCLSIHLFKGTILGREMTIREIK